MFSMAVLMSLANLLAIGAALMAAGFFGLGIANARLVHSTKANSH